MKALTLKLSDSQKKRQKSAHGCLAKIQTWSTYTASKRGKKGCPVCIMEETSVYSKRTTILCGGTPDKERHRTRTVIQKGP